MKTTTIKQALIFSILAISQCAISVVNACEPNNQLGTAKVIESYTQMQWAKSLPQTVYSDLSGSRVSLEQYKGKLVVVNLWASWCSSCVDEIPELMTFASANKDKPFAIVPISIDQNSDYVRSFLKSKGFEQYQTWLAPEFEAQLDKPTELVPSTIVFDGKGQLIGFAAGPVGWSDESIQQYIEELLEKHAKPSAEPRPLNLDNFLWKSE
ncbi:TlpA family protein disulfide reductase [Paraferrimonas sedimenticola]|uniref:Thioredoxin domain-containing protein n=1 Tax=Paraferrimonas sedimenticola TaxID=375674 RepID=A0AA37VZ15_9GAMM|nr:TlpA disulfide reductase family protein [Paraferrimonas sedimenticola]GLP97331.1 hypothetical protein GCM10007895_26380 [Paraferrimonas sedimenticola]